MQGVFFRVDGADLETGEETYLVLQAASVEEAETVARKQGLLIAGVRRATAADWGAVPSAKLAPPVSKPASRTIVFETPAARRSADQTATVAIPIAEPLPVAATAPAAESIELSFRDEPPETPEPAPHETPAELPVEGSAVTANSATLESLPIIELSLEIEPPSAPPDPAGEFAVTTAPDVAAREYAPADGVDVLPVPIAFSPTPEAPATSARQPVDETPTPAHEPESARQIDTPQPLGAMLAVAEPIGYVEPPATAMEQPIVPDAVTTSAPVAAANAETSLISAISAYSVAPQSPAPLSAGPTSAIDSHRASLTPPALRVESAATVEPAIPALDEPSRLTRPVVEKTGIFADRPFSSDIGSWAVARSPVPAIKRPPAMPVTVRPEMVDSAVANETAGAPAPEAVGVAVAETVIAPSVVQEKIAEPAPIAVEAVAEPDSVEVSIPLVEPAPSPAPESAVLSDRPSALDVEADFTVNEPAAPKVISVTAKPVLVPKSASEPIVQRTASTASPAGARLGNGVRPVSPATKPVGRTAIPPRPNPPGRANGSPVSGSTAKATLPRRPLAASVPPRAVARSTSAASRRLPPTAPSPADSPSPDGSNDTLSDTIAAETLETGLVASESQEMSGVVVGGSGIEQVVTKMALDQAAHAVEHSTGSALERLASASSYSVSTPVMESPEFAPTALADPVAEEVPEPVESAHIPTPALRAALVEPAAIPIAYARPRTAVPGASPLLVYLLAPVGVLLTLAGIGVMVYSLLRPTPTDIADLDKVDFRIESLTQAFVGGMILVAGLFTCIATGLASIARRVKVLLQ